MPQAATHARGCARCLREQHWNVAGIARVGPYSDKLLKSAILGLKFAGDDRIADFLGRLVADTIARRADFTGVDVLVPVPMHRLRRWQRPCDHAYLLATAAAKALRNRYGQRVVVREAAVRRVLYAPSQTRAPSVAQRFRNVKGCFAAAGRPGIAGRSVCVVDNLLVTGATLHEVAKVLRRAGAGSVRAAVVARSVPAGETARAAVDSSAGGVR